MIGFPVGAIEWRAIEKSGFHRSARTGDLASSLNPKTLQEFGLYPVKHGPTPDLRLSVPVPPGAFQFPPAGGFRMLTPEIIDELQVIRRREFELSSPNKRFEVWFVGLLVREQPTVWVHVRPGLVEVTLRGPSDAGPR